MADSSRDEIAKLEALYANNPEGRVFTHLAEALRRAGDLERARTILETGLVKHAAYASAHVVLGRVLMGLHQVEEGAEAFRRVLGLDPHNLVALRSLGDIARAAGRNAEALSYFEELRHQDPNNEEIGEIIAELSASPSAFAVESAPGDQEQEELGSRFDPEEAAVAVSALQADRPDAEAEPQALEAGGRQPVTAEPEPPAEQGDAADAAPDWEPEAISEPEPFSEPMAGTEPDAEPEPMSAAEPDVARSDAPMGAASSDIDLDWVPPDEAESEDGLPGDLGSYASLTTMAELPEVPTFGLPEDNEIDLGDDGFVEPGGAVDAAGAADYEDINFDPLPASEADVEPDAYSGDIDITPPPTAPDYETLPDSALEFSAPMEESAPEGESADGAGLEVEDLEPEPAPEAYEAAAASEFPGEVTAPEAAAGTPAFDEPVFDEPVFDEPDSAEPAFDEQEATLDQPSAAQPSAIEESPVADSPAVSEEDDAPEFVTETIAELYRSQGLHDRAAEVYMTLLNQRPGDPGLEAKLLEVQALARGESPVVDEAPTAEPATAPGWEDSLSRDGEPGFAIAAIDPIEAAEPEVPDPAEAWLAGAMGTADSAPTPYAWAEQAPESDDDAPPITNYFRSLLSWKPSAGPTVATDVAPADAPVESAATFDEVVLDAPVPPSASESYTPETADAGADEIVFDDLPDDHDDGMMHLTEEMASEPPPALTAATVIEAEPLPWEEPVAAAPPVVEEPAPAPFEPGIATNSEDAFDEWFGDPEAAQGAQPAVASTSAADDADDADSLAPEAGSDDGEDDDDLEMFRSWLQSLKK